MVAARSPFPPGVPAPHPTCECDDLEHVHADDVRNDEEGGGIDRDLTVSEKLIIAFDAIRDLGIGSLSIFDRERVKLAEIVVVLDKWAAANGLSARDQEIENPSGDRRPYVNRTVGLHGTEHITVYEYRYLDEKKLVSEWRPFEPMAVQS